MKKYKLKTQKSLFDAEENQLKKQEAEECSDPLALLRGKEIQQVIQDYALFPGDPCPKCGCPLYWRIEEYVYCVRCWPPRGYHRFSDLIDRLWGRVRKF